VINSKFAILAIAAFAAMVSPAFAQQAADAAKTAPTTQSESNTESNTPTPADAEAAATAALIAKANAAAVGKKTSNPNDEAAFAKKAKDLGWHAENRQGVTVYCRDAPLVGSRFTKKVCGTATQLAVVLEQQESEKEALAQHGCTGSCSSK